MISGIRNILFFALLVFAVKASAQSVGGYVMDENNQPVPHVNVYVKYTSSGTSTDDKGRYFLQLDAGTFDLVFSAIGFRNKETKVTLTDGASVQKNIWLAPSDSLLHAVTVTASKKDPAYAIIKEVIAGKDKYVNPYNSLECDVYLKATERSGLSEKAEARKAKREAKLIAKGDTTITKNKNDSIPRLNMTEATLIRHFEAPGKIKEIKNAYKTIGDSYGLFYQSTTEGDFNFYKNLLIIHGLSEGPLISPLSRTALLSYRYKLIESNVDERNHLIYKIDFWPWKSGNATFKGTMWIDSELKALTKVRAVMDKSLLNKYDSFVIEQDYSWMSDTVPVISKQHFNYVSKSGTERFIGNTKVLYSGFKLNRGYKKRFFSNEIGVVGIDAEKLDSTFWNLKRPEPLSKEEQVTIAYHDSIYEHEHSEAYLDSVDSVYNKLTLAKVFYHGFGNRKRSVKRSIYLGSVNDMIDLFEIGGLRIGPWGNYFKKYENEQWYSLNGNFDYGFRNKDIKGQVSATWRYDPFRLSSIQVYAGKNFDLINPYEAYINMLRKANFYERTYVGFTHWTEIVNGLNAYLDVDHDRRRNLNRYVFADFTDRFFEENNDPINFNNYVAFFVEARLNYTPMQKYIREKRRKVVLGSKWPTFGIRYKKGLKGVFGSTVDFDFIEFDIYHQYKVGTIGTSTYRFATGKFTNSKNLPLVDQKFHRQGDPFLYSNPLYSFQLLEKTLSALNTYYEFHYMHHFNGAFFNNIPLVKKTRIQAVGGGGALYMTDVDHFHSELFVGLERVFKIARRRFRFGVYGVVSESNKVGFNRGLKFSVEMYNNQENRWRF